jgi:hypothetical protein
VKAGDVAKGSVSAIMGRDAFPPALSEVVECGQVRTGDVSAIADRAVAAGLRLMHSKIRHIGAGYSKEVLQRMYGYLVSHGVTVHLGSEVVSILEMLEALDRICLGVYSRDTLLYGAEVKFYSSRLQSLGSLRRGAYCSESGSPRAVEYSTCLSSRGFAATNTARLSSSVAGRALP